MAVTYTYPEQTVTLSGGATEAKQDVIIANQDEQTAILQDIEAGVPEALGQTTMANSMPVVIASNQGAVPVSGPLTDTQLRATAVPISAASLPLPTGASTESTLSTLNGKVTAVNTGAVVISSSALPTGASTESTLSTLNGKVTAVNTGAVVVASSALPSGASTEATLSTLNGKVTAVNTGAVTISAALPAGSNVIGALTANQSVNVAQINGVTPLMGNGVTGTGSHRITIASDTSTNTNPFLVTEQKSATATLSNVSSSASSVTVLASNASRKGAYVYNDSTASLYLKFGATASTTSFTVLILPASFYELPSSALYTGILDGIWSAANGSARVTELS